MADQREVFTVLESSAGAGLAWVRKAEGDSSTSVGLAPVVTAKDNAGNLTLMPVKVQGNAIGNAVPSLVGKDPTGNLVYLNLTAQGELVTTGQPAGTKLRDVATVTAVVGTETLVAEIALTVEKLSQDIKVIASNTFATLWKVYSDDDGTEVEIGQFLTGPGQFSFKFCDENLEVLAGATGVQRILVKGKQLIGAASDLHVNLSAFELA